MISTDLIKQLRQLTGSSVALCKKALEKANGDMEHALAALAKSSHALAGKKSERATKAGIVEAYVHGNQKIGVLVELFCETDFVSRNSEFQKLAHEIALHIAGANSLYVSSDNIPDDARAEAERMFRTETERMGKSKDMTEKILQGKLDAYFREVSLLSQPFIKDPSLTVEELIQQNIAHFGENITIGRFVRFDL